MFEFFKKKRNQENENLEKNENLEMNEISSEDSENISEKPESIFPNAKEMLVASKQKWKDVTAEKLLKEMLSEASKGYRYVKMYDTSISKELVKELLDKGYKVKVQPEENKIGPWFEISW